jgi:hypothetical protein
MSARLLPVAFACALLATACHVGSRAETNPLARRPVGSRITCAMNGAAPRTRRSVRGELFAVADSSLLVSDGPVLARVLYDHLDWCTFASVPDLSAANLRFRDSAYRTRLRLAARYPGGVNAAQLAALLAARHQDSVQTW